MQKSKTARIINARNRQIEKTMGLLETVYRTIVKIKASKRTAWGQRLLNVRGMLDAIDSDMELIRYPHSR